MSSGYKSVLAAVAAVTLPSAYAHRFRQAEPAQLQRSHHAAERTEARGSRPTAPQSCHKIPDAPAASCTGLQRSGFCEPHTTLHPPSHLKKRAALPVPPWQPAAKRASITPQTSQTPQITTVETVRQACKDICAQDPRVVGAAAAATATSNHTGITSCKRDEVLRRWEMTKLIQLLPAEIVQRIVGLSPDQFPHRNSRQIAEYLLAKAHSVHHKTIASARCTLSRLLSFLSANDLDWDQHFGRLTELDLFAFLMTVHTHATANATPARPGFGAVWGAYASLTFMNTHLCFQLPLHQVRSAIPKRDVKRGAGAIINGAIPLPPEALQALCSYITAPSTPPVMRSWAHALVFSAFSSLRQTNAQHITFYGRIRVDNCDFLVSHHTDGKSRDKMPVVFLTPLQDFSGSQQWHLLGKAALWPTADFLWAAPSGDPLDPSSTLQNCPLASERIIAALQLVLQHACNMPPAIAKLYTQQSARKTLVSAAQAAGCPWDQCIELGHWSARSLDSSFLMCEQARHKRALECMPMPKRYSANVRLCRVARIITNQMRRLTTYLAQRTHVHGPARWDTAWDSIPAYCAAIEGT